MPLSSFLAGATAIQVGTGIFVDLVYRSGSSTISRGGWMKRGSSLEQIVGIANDGFRLGQGHALAAWESLGV